MVRIMDRLSKREVESLSELIAKNEMKDMTLLMRNEYNIQAFLDMFESWLRVSGFVYRRDISGSVHIFVIQHDMGERWSTYFEKLVEYIFEDLNEKKPSFDISDNLISFRISPNHTELVSPFLSAIEGSNQECR